MYRLVRAIVRLEGELSRMPCHGPPRVENQREWVSCWDSVDSCHHSSIYCSKSFSISGSTERSKTVHMVLTENCSRTFQILDWNWSRYKYDTNKYFYSGKIRLLIIIQSAVTMIRYFEMFRSYLRQLHQRSSTIRNKCCPLRFENWWNIWIHNYHLQLISCALQLWRTSIELISVMRNSNAEEMLFRCSWLVEKCIQKRYYCWERVFPSFKHPLQLVSKIMK